MRKILFIFCMFSSILSKTPKLVILRGTACAGKSSICRALMAQDKSWHTVSVDDEYISLLESMCWEHCPGQMAILEKTVAHTHSFESDHFFHALKWHNIVYKKDISDEMRFNALRAIDDIRAYFDHLEIKLFHEELKKNVYDKVCSLLNQNKNVILESWLYFEEISSQKNQFTTTIVLAYCPLQTCLDRLIHRSCIEQEAPAPRYYRTLLLGFISQFQAAQSDKEVIDTFNIHAINNCFEFIQSNIKDRPVIEDGSFSRNEFNNVSLANFHKNFINHFTLSANKKVRIRSIATYDLLLRTDKLSSSECVEIILNSFTQPLFLD